jgi:drug/metabolite transporter (DMT)-like permease
VAAGLVFGERLTPVQLLGGAAILGAVVVAEWEAIRPAQARRRRGR